MIYQKLLFSEIELIKKIEEITSCDYDIKDGYVELDVLMMIIDDLFSEYKELIKKIKDLKNDIRDNYKRISIEEQVL